VSQKSLEVIQLISQGCWKRDPQHPIVCPIQVSQKIPLPRQERMQGILQEGRAKRKVRSTTDSVSESQQIDLKLHVQRATDLPLQLI